MLTVSEIGQPIFLKVQILDWVSRTVDRMRATGKGDIASWKAYWLETYYSLGGTKESVGNKGCPSAAAYGLYRTGWLLDSGVKPVRMEISDIYDFLDRNKNATYAVIAGGLLFHGVDHAELWNRVRSTFRDACGVEAAESDQGAGRLTSILYDNHRLVS